jgi:hypothetical protein
MPRWEWKRVPSKLTMPVGVQAEGGDGGGVRGVPDAEDATFLVQGVAVGVLVGERHGKSS